MAGAAAEDIALHDHFLDRLETSAERALATGALEDAVACVQTAAGIAAVHHPGRFASPRCEAVLDAVAAATLPDLPRVARTPGAAPRVLHVMTSALSVGGHTRLTWRWIERDAARRHDVILTEPPAPPPDELIIATQASGGEVVGAGAWSDSRIARAATVRQAAAQADVIVLNLQANDAVGTLAFCAWPQRPPTLMVNHADHCHWLGRHVTDVLVSHRRAGSAIAETDRGLPAARCTELPLTVGATPALDRATARERSGLPADATVILTVANPYKFATDGEPSLVELVDPVLARRADVVLVAVGPEDEGVWQAARVRHGGRVVALGWQSGVETLHAAADVYLDSYPCSSGTAVLEAAAAGLPVLSYAPDAVEFELLGSAGAQEGLWPALGDAGSFDAALDALCASAPARADAAATTAAALAAWTDDARWREALEAIYARAGALGPLDAATELADPDGIVGPRDHILSGLQRRGQLGGGAELVDRIVTQLELATESPAMRSLLHPIPLGAHGYPVLERRFARAIAAPPAHAEAAAAVVGELRRVHASGLASGLAITVAPDELDALVPLLETALADGPEIDIDLVPAARALAVPTLDDVLLRVDGDGFGDDADPRIPQHEIHVTTAAHR